MKKTGLIFAIIVIFFACKKEKTPEFTATDVTGTTIVKGNISKEVITPNPNGTWNNQAKIVAPGVVVSVRVNKSSLYPNSTAEGADVYTGTTDVNGNYYIAVKSNAVGVQAQITIEGFTGTKDTLVGGIVKSGLYSSYTGISVANTLFMGQNTQLDYNFSPIAVSTNTNNSSIGTAIVTGSVATTFIKETKIGNVIVNSVIYVAKTSHPVYLSLNKDPFTLGNKIYTALTDANGFYTFTVSTVMAGTAGFNQVANVWAEDLSGSQDTVKPDNTIRKGRAGVYTKVSLTQNNVYSNAIRNASHLNYVNFIPN